MDDLHARVVELERLVEHLYQQMNVASPGPRTGVSSQVLAYVAKGDKIRAIKQYREETGCDLRTAKHFVEGLG